MATTAKPKDIEALAAALTAGDRRALARAITLVESSREDHREAAERLLERLMTATGGAVRIGVSGAPGVGKSTFIEAFGGHLTGLGHRIAVLAVDPSSARSGGSILGDKTRMPELARNGSAFIRPSPSGGTAGGVARRTREAMLLVEAAGFEVVIVETVGVGQSELAVEDMVDTFLLLVAPGGGDELQGIKRGVMELADLVVVTKADGELETPARHAAADYRSALTLIRPKADFWRPEVCLVSALEGQGMPEVWEAVSRHADGLKACGELAARRQAQVGRWLWSEIEHGLREAFTSDAAIASALPDVEAEVAAGRLGPTQAARRLLEVFRKRR
ncbi:MAG: methylmalonyl Co-A mutase-associated GTPase MeaB [Alphaproteobacteria bacterium]|jgi:LAO/AO transport system kinase|nr:methylmalonyl Co-A mutase-associated GTPase MeaB [Alphaproteobacteria bacterium]